MRIYILKRLISLLTSLIAASIVIFVVVEIVPGDPASFMLGINADPEAVEALRQQLGLNAPVIERYFIWIFNLLTGDFGISHT